MLRRKYLVRCAECALMFRTPTTNPEKTARFYQTKYEQGFTTDLLNEQMLGRLKTTAFKGTEEDYASYIEVLSGLGVEGRLSSQSGQRSEFAIARGVSQQAGTYRRPGQ